MNTLELSNAALDYAVHIARRHVGLMPVNYSTDWQHAGPIIEREKITICPNATTWWAVHPDTELEVHGATPLEAAMRAYVHAKLGEELP